MRVLTPAPSDDEVIAAHVALPATRPTGRALVRLNMISSSDGGTAIAGVSGGLGNRNDHAVFAALRELADGGARRHGDRRGRALPTADAATSRCS